jgi:hypothetical protein
MARKAKPMETALTALSLAFALFMVASGRV